MKHQSLTKTCLLLMQRELLLAYRQRAELLNPLLFFVIVICLFPLALSPDPHLLAVIAPGIIWVAALLATLLSLDRLFRTDAAEGFLDHLLLSRHPLILLVFSKVMAHWLVTGLPLLLITPLLGILLHLPGFAILILCSSLLLGTPILSLIGAIFTALTLPVRGQGLLLPLLVLPFYIPVLIFGASSVTAAANGLSASGQLAFLGALLALALPLAPFATASVLRLAVL